MILPKLAYGFKIAYKLEAGKPYYIKASGYLNITVSNVTLTVERVNMDVTEFKVNGDENKAKLGHGNKVSFLLTGTDAGDYNYTVKLQMGWDNGVFYDKASQSNVKFSVGGTTKNITFNNITIDGTNGKKLKTRILVMLGNDVLWTSSEYTQNVTEIMPVKLEFTKSNNKNFIYVNNPEYITNRDIVDDPINAQGNPQGIQKLKIFEQKDVTGENTYYQTHVAWWDAPHGYDSYFPNNPNKNNVGNIFYIDVDFYNQSSSPVTIKVGNLAYGSYNDETKSPPGGGYALMQNYYDGGAPSEHSITIPVGGHKLLLQDIFGVDSLLCTDPLPKPPSNWNPDLYPNRDWHWQRAVVLFSLFDFTVSGGSVTVSSLAAYNSNNLRLSGTGNTLVNGGAAINNGEMLFDNSLNGRPGEEDIYQKYKGIDRNHSAWIDVNLEYFISDSITIPSDGRILPIKLTDPLYEPEGALGLLPNENIWKTNLNPSYDEWATLLCMPSAIHSFKYSHGNRMWNFDMEHRDASQPNLGGGVHDSMNNPIPVQTINAIVQSAKTGVVMSSKPEPQGLGIGEWGATYHYTITINNNSSSDRQAALEIRNCENMIYGWKLSGQQHYDTTFIPSLRGQNNWWCPHSITIPAGKDVTYEVVTMLGGGVAGPDGRIKLY